MKYLRLSFLVLSGFYFSTVNAGNHVNISHTGFKDLGNGVAEYWCSNPSGYKCVSIGGLNVKYNG